ncbi:hypothetical protein [Polyangium spumosum]|uniref:Mu-like prophage FluMu N-terminal domain-containing protein n=1 Tax=Polyangium spumosum TaxID=889282 RepID=A0A6N7Q2P7_9BACT|nr:hypothetical protein [Polyangium spumosum]MRG98309.1 hypothetical protein [Polyangium spumosum]
MIIVTCVPPPGYDAYRCGWREEERDGRKVRIGLCWKAGATELPDDALTREQIEMLKRDPGKRITVRELPGVEQVRAPRSKEPIEAKGKASKESGEAKETGET